MHTDTVGEPNIDIQAIKQAWAAIDRVEFEIQSYAETFGLPVNSVFVDSDGMAHVRCGERVFLGVGKKRNLTETVCHIGPRLWAMLREAAGAYEAKRSKR